MLHLSAAVYVVVAWFAFIVLGMARAMFKS